MWDLQRVHKPVVSQLKLKRFYELAKPGVNYRSLGEKLQDVSAEL